MRDKRGSSWYNDHVELLFCLIEWRKEQKMENELKRDKKGRLLRKGESQLSNGRYRFRYTDTDGNKKTVYSWRLDRNDRMIKGKPRDLSLREKEKQIARDMFDRIIPDGGKLTVSELVVKYTETKIGVKPSTRQGYKTVIRFLEKDPIGNHRIDRIRLSDAKMWLINLQKSGRSYSWIHQIRGVVKPAFRMAVEDDLIRKSPFDFELATVVYNDSEKREAVTEWQEHQFLEFIRNDPHFSRYYDGMYILFHTGLRISEFVGLTIRDIDFDDRKVVVDHQLVYINGKGLTVQSPKTDSGNRKVPMSREVEECFRRVIADRPNLKVEPAIDGYAGFLFINEWGNPKAAYQWEKYFQHALEKYNSQNRLQLPRITPHICRHTFCSRMAKAGMNPKTLQYIMGHSDITVTMNVYAHVQADDAGEEMSRILGEDVGGSNSNVLKLAR